MINRFGDAGVQLLRTSCFVRGCFIGTDFTGTIAQGNGVGIDIAGSHFVTGAANTIGGTTTAAHNVISGNLGDGVHIEGGDSIGHVIQGNLIGTDITGTADLGNGAAGVRLLLGPSGNLIGGTDSGAGNVISGNGGDGVVIESAFLPRVPALIQNNKVQGNRIGTDATGTAALGNGGNGVTLQELARGNLVGGTSPGARNIISGNRLNGVEITRRGHDRQRGPGQLSRHRRDRHARPRQYSRRRPHCRWSEPELRGRYCRRHPQRHLRQRCRGRLHQGRRHGTEYSPGELHWHRQNRHPRPAKRLERRKRQRQIRQHRGRHSSRIPKRDLRQHGIRNLVFQRISGEQRAGKLHRHGPVRQGASGQWAWRRDCQYAGLSQRDRRVDPQRPQRDHRKPWPRSGTEVRQCQSAGQLHRHGRHRDHRAGQ